MIIVYFSQNLLKVDCWDVVELFALYRLLIKDGFAYISDNELIALVAPKFRENISLSLAHARRNIGVLQEEERLIPLMKHMVSGGIAYRKEFK
jgi:DNA primase large subunit